jgi:hypothetical protein
VEAADQRIALVLECGRWRSAVSEGVGGERVGAFDAEE